MNDAGEPAGFSATANDEAFHAVAWRNGLITDLGTVGNDNFSRSFGMNVKGQIVGQSWLFDGENTTASHAFLWEDGSPIIDLNTLIANPTDLFLTEANFITDRGWIVANGPLPNGDLRAAILIPDEDAVALGLQTTVSQSAATAKPVTPTPEQLRAMKTRKMPRYRPSPLRRHD